MRTRHFRNDYLAPSEDSSVLSVNFLVGPPSSQVGLQGSVGSLLTRCNMQGCDILVKGNQIMADIQAWFKSLPVVTRYWFGLTVGFSLAGRFGILPAKFLYLDYYGLFNSFQIWRPFTAAFYYPLTPQTGFHFLINLYFLYNYSLRLETGPYNGRPADYMFMQLFVWTSAVLVGLMMSIPLLMDILVLATLYVWCQLNKDVIVQFWFGTQFPAVFLPWVLFGFNLIMSGGGLMELTGIAIGHLYFFLMFKYPQDFGGSSFLQTPEFLYRYLPNHRPGPGGSSSAPRAGGTAAAAGDGRHSWGRGNPLGN